MKIFDFKQVTYQDIEGNECLVDIAKQLGNHIFSKTTDIGELDLAREIYHKGVVELTKEQAEAINDYARTSFVAFVHVPLCKQLNDLFNNE